VYDHGSLLMQFIDITHAGQKNLMFPSGRKVSIGSINPKEYECT